MQVVDRWVGKRFDDRAHVDLALILHDRVPGRMLTHTLADQHVTGGFWFEIFLSPPGRLRKFTSLAYNLG